MHHGTAGTLAAILFFSLIAGPARAQDEQAALQALLQSSPGKVYALTTGSTTSTTPDPNGRTLAVYGELGSGSLASAEDTAKTFVRTHGRALGFPDGEPLAAPMRKFREWPRSGTDDAGKFIQYCPHRDGRPFINGIVTFCFKPDGKLVAVLGRYIELTGVEEFAIATAEEATQAAILMIERFHPETRGHVTGNGEVAEYLVDGGDGRLRRMFVLGMTAGVPPMPKRVILGGPSPMIEDARELENSCDVFEWDPGTSWSTVNRDLVNLIDPGFWPDWTVNGQHFKVDSRISSTVERASDWNGWWDEEPKSPRNPNPKFGELHVYYHLTQGRTKALGWGMEKDLAKHPVLFFNHWVIPNCGHFDANSEDERKCEERQTNNAWFSPTDTTLNFASQNPLYFGNYPAYDATAIYHEYAHFLHKLASEHWMQGAITPQHLLRAKCISEAFADLFTAAATGRTRVGWFLQRKRSAPGSSTAVDQSRNLEQLKTMDDVAALEYHLASVVFSASCWRLKTDGVLGGDSMIKTLIMAMRLSKLPCDLFNGPAAVMAADQMLAGTPHTSQIGQRFNAQQLIPALRTAGSP